MGGLGVGKAGALDPLLLPRQLRLRRLRFFLLLQLLRLLRLLLRRWHFQLRQQPCVVAVALSVP